MDDNEDCKDAAPLLRGSAKSTKLFSKTNFPLFPPESLPQGSHSPPLFVFHISKSPQHFQLQDPQLILYIFLSTFSPSHCLRHKHRPNLCPSLLCSAKKKADVLEKYISLWTYLVTISLCFSVWGRQIILMHDECLHLTWKLDNQSLYGSDALFTAVVFVFHIHIYREDQDDIVLVYSKVGGSCLKLVLCSLKLLFSSRNGKPDKSFLFTVALNSLKAVIRISIFSKVPQWFKVALLGSSHYLD